MNSLSFWSIVLAGALTLSTPIILAALGEVFLERAGGFNVGIEGMMLMGAVAGVVGSMWGGVWAGLLAGAVVGALFGLLFGLATAVGRASHVIVGVGLGLVGTGMSSCFYQILAPAGSSNVTAPVQPGVDIMVLKGIPVIGLALSSAGPFFYMAALLTLVSGWVLRNTRFGLRLCAVGHDPRVAAMRGISGMRFRIGSAVIAGAFAGLGGAAVPLSSIGSFTPGMTGGDGFVALAVVIIGRRRPLGVLAGALLFAIFDSLALLAQTQELGLPLEFYGALPYLVTLLILCAGAKLVKEEAGRT